MPAPVQHIRTQANFDTHSHGPSKQSTSGSLDVLDIACYVQRPNTVHPWTMQTQKSRRPTLQTAGLSSNQCGTNVEIYGCGPG